MPLRIWRRDAPAPNPGSTDLTEVSQEVSRPADAHCGFRIGARTALSARSGRQSPNLAGSAAASAAPVGALADRNECSARAPNTTREARALPPR